MITGIVLFSRMRRMTSSPSMPGIITSRKTASKPPPASARSPRGPSGAATRVTPFRPRYSASRAWSRWSSSMQRTRRVMDGPAIMSRRRRGRRAPLSMLAFAPGVDVAGVSPAPEVREARGEAEHGAEGEDQDEEPASHGRLPSPAGGAAALEQVGQVVALPLVEGRVDASQGIRDPRPQRRQDLVLLPVDRLELLPVECLLAQRDRQVAPGRLEAAAKPARRLPEGGRLVAEDLLLRRGRVDAPQDAPQGGARTVAAAVGSGARPVPAPVPATGHSDAQDETEGADDESEHVCLLWNARRRVDTLEARRSP